MNATVDLLNKIICNLTNSSVFHTDDTTFNIFRVLGVQTKEVIICRFIAELLDPNGTHKMGKEPLAAFFETVLNEKIPNGIENARIETEEPIDKERRVDIAIHIGNKVFPLEVKIWAGDQDAQLFDYYSYYKKKKSIDKIYYLTPYGWNPSQASVKSLDPAKVKCISFVEDILSWLNHLTKTDMLGCVETSIQQFKEIINDMCKENQQLETIKTILNLDSENTFEVNDILKAAVAIINEKEALRERIIVNYLKKHIKAPDEYSIIEDTTKDIDKNSYLVVMKDDRCFAWICVETNLYIVAKKVKTEKEGELWKEVGEDYVWQYLHPDGSTKKFPLKQLDCIFKYKDKIIEIQKYIDDII